MEYNRSSNEIMKEILYLLSEYNQAKECEDRIQSNRLDALEVAFANQDAKIKQAAKILLGD